MATQYIAAGAAELGVPNPGDDIYVLGGSATINSNMDWSSVQDANKVEIPYEFTGNFGTSTAPFKAKVTEVFSYGAQAGKAFFVSDGSIADISPRLLMPVGTGGHLTFDTNGTVTDAEIAAGEFTIGTAVVVTNLYVGFGARVNFTDDGSTDPTLIKNMGGSINLDRGATTLTHIGGITLIKGPNASPITTLNIFGDGVELQESGTITTANCDGGIPNVRKIVRPITISNTFINMALPGAEDFLQHSMLTHSSVTKYFK